MKANKPIQNLQVAGVTIKYGDDKPVVVETAKITKQQWSWDGNLIDIRKLGDGKKSQIVRLV